MVYNFITALKIEAYIEALANNSLSVVGLKVRMGLFPNSKCLR
jgi:hypothetical protein